MVASQVYDYALRELVSWFLAMEIFCLQQKKIDNLKL